MPDQIVDLRSLRDAVRRGHRPTYLMFWGHRPSVDEVGQGCLSQWWAASFVVDGRSYLTAERFDVVVRGNLAKFRQHPELASFLEQWRGLNLLGFALMAVRRTLAGDAQTSRG